MPEKSSALLQFAKQRPLSATMGVLFVVLSAVIGYELFRFLQTLNHEVPSHSIRKTQVSAATPVNTLAIRNSHLFGKLSAPSLDQLSGSNLPQTNLALSLRGVFTAVKQNNASAIIERSDGVAKTFRVGQRIDNETSLHAVYPDRVLLNRSGLLESLYFPELADQAENQLAQTATALTQTGASPETSDATTAFSNTNALSDAQKQLLIRKRLEALRDRARKQRTAPNG